MILLEIIWEVFNRIANNISLYRKGFPQSPTYTTYSKQNNSTEPINQPTNIEAQIPFNCLFQHDQASWIQPKLNPFPSESQHITSVHPLNQIKLPCRYSRLSSNLLQGLLPPPVPLVFVAQASTRAGATKTFTQQGISRNNRERGVAPAGKENRWGVLMSAQRVITRPRSWTFDTRGVRGRGYHILATGVQLSPGELSLDRRPGRLSRVLSQGVHFGEIISFPSTRDSSAVIAGKSVYIERRPTRWSWRCHLRLCKWTTTTTQ